MIRIASSRKRGRAGDEAIVRHGSAGAWVRASRL